MSSSSFDPYRDNKNNKVKVNILNPLTGFLSPANVLPLQFQGETDLRNEFYFPYSSNCMFYHKSLSYPIDKYV
jgi:hypothetical protein